jgi:hypothetical protein
MEQQLSGKVFVSIPAWEDTELLDTMNKCLSSAKYPEKIVFGLGLNYEDEPDLSSIPNEMRVVRDHFDYGDVKNPGIIQVRNAIRRMIEDEEYFLSIDAHANFDTNWDETLINDINELNTGTSKYVISKQIVAPGEKTNYYTQWHLRKEPFDIGGQVKIDPNLKHSSQYMINDKYFLNYYVSGNFIFGQTNWIKSMDFPDYHGFPYEEPELSMAVFCNGFDVVSPIGSHCPLAAGNDPKYQFPYDEKWWNFVGQDRNNPRHWEKVWVNDDPEMSEEVRTLMRTGKNKYYSFENLPRTVYDFYVAIQNQI